jgi:hypothetical protein
MTSEQQGPTDEVLGHGLRLPPEDETAGDDRGARIPPDDAEGHAIRRVTQDTEAVDDDRGVRIPPEDTEGHGVRFPQDTEAVDEDQVGDDAEGHWRL